MRGIWRALTRTRLTWIIVAAPAALVLWAAVALILQVRQGRPDAELIAALKGREDDRAIGLLDEGADANAIDDLTRPKTIRDLITALFQRRRNAATSKNPRPSAIVLACANRWTVTWSPHSVAPDMVCFSPRPANPTLLKAMLARGADPNTTLPANPLDGGGLTLLEAEVDAGSVQSVRLLLDAGADPNHMPTAQPNVPTFPLVLSSSGCSSLAFAAATDRSEIVRLLLEHRAIVDRAGPQSITPLIAA
ncbi:MAG TPA: hypothetical protein VKT77_23450, partial [Chthonomonadaceae bacterium]|nr:hypothetical protein [Chthonomonadaceae bacterium]